MTIEILEITDINRWKYYFNLFPPKQRDIYLSPEYFLQSYDNGFGISTCIILNKDNSLYYFPFLKVSIKDPNFSDFSDYFDIQGPYGYNGMISINPTIENTTIFNEVIHDFALESKAITAFLRCNPVFSNHLYYDPKDVLVQSENVILNLSQEDIYNASYEHSTRKNIKKAKREGLEVKYFQGGDISEDQLNDFINIYYQTMKRNDAESFYYFPNDYFLAFKGILKDSSYFFFAYKDGIPISTELILLNSYVGYSFLGGTLKEYYPYRPNDYLKHHIIMFLKNYGCAYYCLGGGPEGVLRFKKTFAKQGIYDFYTYKKIFLLDIYESIINKWESLYPEKVNKYGSYFQKYRY